MKFIPQSIKDVILIEPNIIVITEDTLWKHLGRIY